MSNPVLIHFICKSVGDHHAPFGTGEPDRFYYIPSCQLKTPEEIEKFYNRGKTLPDGKWLSFKDTLTLGCTNVIEMKYKSEIFSPFNKYITCN